MIHDRYMGGVVVYEIMEPKLAGRKKGWDLGEKQV